MGKQEGKTEPMEVVVVDGLEGNISEEALKRCGTPDVSSISVVPSIRVYTPGVNGESIVAHAACELDKKGKTPKHITMNGKGAVETTRTTAEQRAREAASKKRIENTPQDSKGEDR